MFKRFLVGFALGLSSLLVGMSIGLTLMTLVSEYGSLTGAIAACVFLAFLCGIVYMALGHKKQ